MNNDGSELPTAEARRRLRFAVTGGDVELMATSAGGPSTGRESAGSVAADVRRYLIGKGESRLDDSRLELIMRSPNWRSHFRLELSNTGRAQLVFSDVGEDTSFWMLAPNKAKGWLATRISASDLPEATGADLLFMEVTKRRVSGSSAPERVSAQAVDLARQRSQSDVPLAEQVAWAA